MLHRARSLLLLALVPLAGCGGRTLPDPMIRQGGEGEDRVSVEVRNDNFNDIDVLLVRDGSRRRLGVVTGKDSRRFVLDRSTFPGSGQLRFELDPLGGRRSITTQSVLVSPGETVMVEIGIDLTSTRVSVRR